MVDSRLIRVSSGMGSGPRCSVVGMVIVALTGCHGGSGAGPSRQPVADASSSDASPSGRSDTSSPSAGEVAAEATMSADAAPDQMPVPLDWFVFDDFEGGSLFPTFWAVAGATAPDSRDRAPEQEIMPPRQTSRRAMRLKGTAMDAGVDVSVHHHFDWSRLLTAVRFWARAEQPGGSELIVALTDIRSSLRTFYQDQTDGYPWLSKRVTLSSEWRQYTIAFEEFAAETPGMPVGVYGPGEGPEAGTELHFLVPAKQDYDLWIDDVELKCRPDSCAQLPRVHSP